MEVSGGVNFHGSWSPTDLAYTSMEVVWKRIEEERRDFHGRQAARHFHGFHESDQLPWKLLPSLPLTLR